MNNKEYDGVLKMNPEQKHIHVKAECCSSNSESTKRTYILKFMRMALWHFSGRLKPTDFWLVSLQAKAAIHT